MSDKIIPQTTLRRLPVYLHYLNSLGETRKNISSSQIAAQFGLNDVQVRKDLASVSGTGKPKTGYDTSELIAQLENVLGREREIRAILIGAGNLGRALMTYDGFRDYGLSIIAAFDSDPDVYGGEINGKPILNSDELESFCADETIRLGIITVPISFAQQICDRLVDCGIKAIWNFAPTILKVPQGVVTENENLASSLAILSKKLNEV